MAKIVQRRRGTTTDHNNFPGAAGEITVDLTDKTVRVYDGDNTPFAEGQPTGYPLARADMSNVSGNASGGGVGIAQLNVIDGTTGQVLTADGAGNMSFQSIDITTDLQLGGDLSGLLGNAQIITNAIGINELNVTAPSSGGQVLSADISGNLEFITPVTNMNLIGDITGTLTNTQISSLAVGTAELGFNVVTTDKLADANVTTAKLADANVTTAKLADANVTTAKLADANVTTAKLANNSVGITQLNVNDGSVGQLLSTNGSGVLSFIPQLTSLALGGDLTGTSDNAVIAAGAVEDSMIVGLDAAKLTGILPALSGANLTGVYNNITTAFATEPFITEGSSNGNGVRTITGIGFQPSYVICYAGRLMTGIILNNSSLSVGAGTPTTQITGTVGVAGTASSGGVSTGKVAFMQVGSPVLTKSVVLTSFDSDGITYTTSSSGTGSGGSWRIAFTFFG